MWWAKILEILRSVWDGSSSLNVTLVGGAVGGQTVKQGDPNAGGADAWPVDTAPPAAGSVGQANFTVNSTEGALTGTSARGFLLFNNSSGGQTIYFGDTGLSASTGFPLRAGDAVDRPTWQDLSVVFALASADGADLRAVPL